MRSFSYICLVHMMICISAIHVFGDVVHLTNGRTLHGTFISLTSDIIEGESVGLVKFQMSYGKTIELHRREISFVQLASGEIIIGTKPHNGTEFADEASGKIHNADPLASRYVYAPSAFSLSKGKGYVSQKQLFFTAGATGITDNVAFLFGSVLPIIFQEFNVITGVKVGRHVVNDFRVATGFEVLSTSDFNLGFVFVNGTYGNNNFHLSVIAGKPFVRTSGEKETGSYLNVVALNKKLSKRWRFVSETWFVPDVCTDNCGNGASDTETFWISGNVARGTINEHFVIDTGFIFFKNVSDFAYPWLDVTYAF